jgi:hypothetical protein
VDRRGVHVLAQVREDVVDDAPQEVRTVREQIQEQIHDHLDPQRIVGLCFRTLRFLRPLVAAEQLGQRFRRQLRVVEELKTQMQEERVENRFLFLGVGVEFRDEFDCAPPGVVVVAGERVPQYCPDVVLVDRRVQFVHDFGQDRSQVVQFYVLEVERRIEGFFEGVGEFLADVVGLVPQQPQLHEEDQLVGLPLALFGHRGVVHQFGQQVRRVHPVHVPPSLAEVLVHHPLARRQHDLAINPSEFLDTLRVQGPRDVLHQLAFRHLLENKRPGVEEQLLQHFDLDLVLHPVLLQTVQQRLEQLLGRLLELLVLESSHSRLVRAYGVLEVVFRQQVRHEGRIFQVFQNPRQEFRRDQVFVAIRSRQRAVQFVEKLHNQVRFGNIFDEQFKDWMSQGRNPGNRLKIMEISQFHVSRLVRRHLNKKLSLGNHFVATRVVLRQREFCLVDNERFNCVNKIFITTFMVNLHAV